MGRIEGAFETSKMVEALSKLFRHSLNSGKEITTVKTEIEHIRNYIAIQQVRFKDAIKFTLDIDNEVLDCQTLKLVLQPLIENAIVHGFENMDKNGEICTTIKHSDDKLLFIIEDNGSGVDLEEIQRLLSDTTDGHRGFAIKNVNDRIKLYFGEEYGLKFEKRESGTTVVVSQRYYKEDQQEGSRL
jgi:two-component system sensor histidine kinase YesM